MSWFAAIVLRLFMSSLSGLFITLLVSFLAFDHTQTASTGFQSWMLILGPFVAMILFWFTVPELILGLRWKKRWLPLGKGEKWESGEALAKEIKKGCRELTGVWSMPSYGRKRLKKFVSLLSRTLLENKDYSAIAWQIHSFAWYLQKDDSEECENLQRALFEASDLSNEAFQLALKMFGQNGKNLELAVRISNEVPKQELMLLEKTERELLQHAMILVYANVENARSGIQKPLVSLLLESARRDEIAGRIYLDAFIEGDRREFIRREMLGIAEILENTGRNPEMTANLRALAKAGGNASDEHARTEKEEQERKENETPEIKKEASKSIEFKYSVPEKRVEAPDWRRSVADSQKAKKSRFGTVFLVIIVLVAVIVVGYVFWGQDIVEMIPAGEVTETVAVEREKAPVYVQEDKPQKWVTVQISAVPHEEAAESAVRILRAKGMDAYSVKTVRGEAVWYRIRFGKYDTTEKAQAQADSLLTAGDIDEYFITSFEVPDNN